MRIHAQFAVASAICLASSNVSALTFQQVEDAFIASGAGTGNSAVAGALGDLLTVGSDLLSAITTATIAIGTSLLSLSDLELKYSYGQSPPVYPSPQGQGSGSWASAYASAQAAVAQMTDDEKNSILYGQSTTNGCSGFAGGVSRLNYPGMCLNDAESGVRTGNLVNGYPAQLHVGASWNRDLAYSRAQYIGREFKAKGVNVFLGPVVGPLGRIAKGGRNWEGFTNDPYLAGALVGPTVQGMQESVIACVKHFITNEQESNRNPFLAGTLNTLGVFNQSVSSNLDDRTMHELYLWPFYDAVKAGAGSVMASYNRINNSYGSQNSKTLNGLLKTELGFEGFVVSDWVGQHTGIASANAGLDMAMPSSSYWDNNQLATAVSNGSVNETRLTDMATRVLASWYRYAQFPNPGMTAAANVSVRDSAADKANFQAAVEGHVLVKNVNNALPLSKPKVLSLFGYDAIGGLNATDTSSNSKYSFGVENTAAYDDGTPFTQIEYLLFMAAAQPSYQSGPQAALNGTLMTGGGSGATTPAYLISPYDAFKTQAAIDGTTLLTDFTSQKPAVNASTNACIVFVNEQSSESWDRAGLADPYSDKLITNVANGCRNTIVVIHNAGIRLVDAWISHPNITAVIYAHVPGQESGAALAEIIYGRQSPSGRLPYTVGKSEADYGSLLSPTLPDAQNPIFSQSNFTEGVAIDYRSFAQRGVQPRFAFGYGLTYSNFTYSTLQVSVNSSANHAALPPDSTTGIAPEGGLASLYDVLVTASVKVTNTGPVAAAEVAQLYLSIPNSGVAMVLRGFNKQTLQPNASTTFGFQLTRRDLSVWSTAAQQWMLQNETYTVNVGKSVADVQLKQSFSLS